MPSRGIVSSTTTTPDDSLVSSWSWLGDLEVEETAGWCSRDRYTTRRTEPLDITSNSLEKGPWKMRKVTVVTEVTEVTVKIQNVFKGNTILQKSRWYLNIKTMRFMFQWRHLLVNYVLWDEILYGFWCFYHLTYWTYWTSSVELRQLCFSAFLGFLPGCPDLLFRMPGPKKRKCYQCYPVSPENWFSVCCVQ